MALQQIIKQQTLLLKTGDKVIGHGEICSIKDREVVLQGAGFDLKMVEGMSIICEFEHEGNPAHFNAKIKDVNPEHPDQITLFLLGELIVDFKRNYLRINDQIGFSYEKIIFDEVDCYYHQVFKHQQQEPAFDQLLNRYDPYFKIFQFMVKKMDQLTEQITELKGQLDPKESPEFQDKSVNLSASGIRFVVPEGAQFKPGDLIYIVLRLQTIPVTHTSIIGEVLRVVPIGDDLELVVEFRLLDQRVKEQLVQYIFQRDQQQIRNRIR